MVYECKGLKFHVNFIFLLKVSSLLVEEIEKHLGLRVFKRSDDILKVKFYICFSSGAF